VGREGHTTRYFGGSTPGWGCHSLLLLSLLVSMNDVVRYDGIAEEPGEGATSAERHTLLEFGG
jgi:hypothetical protein